MKKHLKPLEQAGDISTWYDRFTLFSKLLALPDKDKTISHYGDQDDAWLKVVRGIQCVIDSLIHPRDGDW